MPPTPQPVITTQTPVNTSSFVYVGFGRRFVAALIDGILLSIIFSILGLNKPSTNALGTLLGAVYYIVLWTYWDGQTLGKKAMGIKVIKENGEKMDIGTSVVRYIGYMISAVVLLLGFIWVLFDAKKQGWHDKIAKTFVVKA